MQGQGCERPTSRQGSSILKLHYTPTSMAVDRAPITEAQIGSRAGVAALQYGPSKIEAQRPAFAAGSTSPRQSRALRATIDDCRRSSHTDPSRVVDHQISAACDDCRRRHKRCVHRVIIDFVRNHDDQCEGFNKHGLEDLQGRKNCLLPQLDSRIEIAEYNRQKDSLFGDIRLQPKEGHSAPRPPNLTKNGKRRGRPPKTHPRTAVRSSRADTNRRCFFDSESESVDTTPYRPYKRRAIDDYEYSDRFQEVISGLSPTDGVKMELHSSDDSSDNGRRSIRLMSNQRRAPVLIPKTEYDLDKLSVSSYSPELDTILCKPKKYDRAQVARDEMRTMVAAIRYDRKHKHAPCLSDRPSLSKKTEKTKRRIMQPIRPAILNSPAKEHSAQGHLTGIYLPKFPFGACIDTSYTSIRDSVLPHDVMAERKSYMS